MPVTKLTTSTLEATVTPSKTDIASFSAWRFLLFSTTPESTAPPLASLACNTLALAGSPTLLRSTVLHPSVCSSCCTPRHRGYCRINLVAIFVVELAVSSLFAPITHSWFSTVLRHCVLLTRIGLCTPKTTLVLGPTSLSLALMLLPCYSMAAPRWQALLVPHTASSALVPLSLCSNEGFCWLMLALHFEDYVLRPPLTTSDLVLL